MSATDTLFTVTFSRQDFERGLDEITQAKKLRASVIRRYDAILEQAGAVPSDVASLLYRETAYSPSHHFSDPEGKYRRAMEAAGLSVEPTPPPPGDSPRPGQRRTFFAARREAFTEWRNRRRARPQNAPSSRSAGTIRYPLIGLAIGILAAIVLLWLVTIWHTAVNAPTWWFFPLGEVLIALGAPTLGAFWGSRRAADRRTASTAPTS